MSIDKATRDVERQFRNRKLEISQIDALINRTKQPEQAVLLRAAVPLLYAHFEGFIKSTTELYLSTVLNEKIVASDLSTNFLALYTRHLIHKHQGEEARSQQKYQDITNAILEYPRTIIPAVVTAHLKSKQNLKPDVLEDIFISLNLDFSSWWQLKRVFISKIFLKKRNEICHGDIVNITPTEYTEMHTFTLEALENFKFKILDNLHNRLFFIDS